MYEIVIANQCSCFKQSNLENNISFVSKDDALLKAVQIRDIMNNEFCGKHEFHLEELKNNFVISFYSSSKTSCCGNGCCN